MALSGPRGESESDFSFGLDRVIVCGGLALMSSGDGTALRDGSETWLADNGATHHGTSSADNMFDVQSPPVGRGHVVSGDDKAIPVRRVGGVWLPNSTRVQ